MPQILNEDCLFNILLHAIQESVQSDGSPLKLRTVPPLNFAAVSRSWNSLLTRRPSLWSFIHIETPRRANASESPIHASVLHFVRLWLENSKGVSLRVRLRIFGTKSDPICKEILGLIFSEQQRWREIDINVSNTDLPTLATVQCSPSLSALTLNLSQVRSRDPLLLDLSSHTAAAANDKKYSRLSKLDISSCTGWVLPQGRERLSLPNLTYLRFYTDLSCELDSVLSVLAASPNIRSLNIYDPPSHTGSSSSVALPRDSTQRRSVVVVLPHLVDFYLSVNRRYDAEIAPNFLLSYLSCPSLLKFLHSSQYLPAQPEHLQCLASFFSNSQQSANLPHPLVELKICYQDSVDKKIPHDAWSEHQQALIELLRPLRHLKHLTFWDLFFDDRFVKELTPQEIEHSDAETEKIMLMLPSLEGLEIGWNPSNFRDAALSIDLVEEMLVARAMCGKKVLTDLKLGAPGSENLGERSERMKDLIGNGLSVFTRWIL